MLGKQLKQPFYNGSDQGYKIKNSSTNTSLSPTHQHEGKLKHIHITTHKIPPKLTIVSN
jgi:hypothetical protein